ncbi:MAG TPA: SurA N-terminal domain-containing protein [Thermohalobaculum sp.]|nr:SurA N-terminal domain-containing protein [Thermohalobaculum sp.]
MLRALRKGAKSLVAKILIGLLVASFAVWGIGDIFSFRLDSRVAKVGDTEIAAEAFANSLQREQNRLTRQIGEVVTLDMVRAAGVDRRILAGMVRDAAFREELDRLGLDAPDEAVAEAIRNDSTFHDVAGKFQPQAYTLLLAQQGISRSTFEENRRFKLAQDMLVETASAAVTPPPGTAARLAAWQGETRTGAVLTLPLDMAPDPGTPDETALNEFYDANKPMFTEPERRSGEYIHVNATKLLEELKPDDEALRQHYEASLARFSTEASRTIDQIIYPDRAAAEAAQGRMLTDGVTFEALAAETGMTEDSLSLGRVTESDLPEAAAAAVFGMSEPGIVGPVVLPAGGAALFRVREVSEAGAAPFEDVRDQLAAELARDALQYRAPEVANQIEELRAEGLTMSEIARKAGVDYGEFAGLAADGALPDGTRAEGVLASTTFLNEVFAALDAEERDLVETPGGGYILVMLRGIAPSELQPLATVRDRAVEGWQAAERRKALEARGEELAARLGEDASIWDIGEELGLAAMPLPSFTQLTPPAAIPARLTEKLFRVPAAGGAAALSDAGDSVMLAQVSEINPLAPEDIARNAAELDGLLTESLSGDVVEYFARAIEASHPTQVDYGVIEEVFRRLGANSPMAQ